MARDRRQTEQRLLQAVHEFISTEGFEQLRINRLAQQAKVNKILIYRYFGGLNGLIQAYYEQYKPVVSATPIDIKRLEGATIEEFFEVCASYILDEFRLLRANPHAQQFLKNDLMAYQPGVANPIAFMKEEQVRNMIDALGEQIKSEYGRPFTAILISAMTMLTFMAQDKRTLVGIELGTDEGWHEIERTIRRIFYGIALATKERIGDHVPIPTMPLSADGQQPA